jgi:hypothetical protein
MKIVGIGLVKRDRPSFDTWYPLHLAQVMELVDRHYIRIGGDPTGVFPHLEPYGDRIEWDVDNDSTRFVEDTERQALLDWASQTDADWVACFDADEVLEEGGAEVLKRWLGARDQRHVRCVSLHLHYSSHHRPGYILPVEAKAWRLFRMDSVARAHRYVADEDGMHCGSVPRWGERRQYRGLKRPTIIHYHATSCEEFMAERAFYDGTAEVAKHGGIDYLYRCDRFGKESEAFPLSDLALTRAEHYARVMPELVPG